MVGETGGMGWELGRGGMDSAGGAQEFCHLGLLWIEESSGGKDPL